MKVQIYINIERERKEGEIKNRISQQKHFNFLIIYLLETERDKLRANFLRFLYFEVLTDFLNEINIIITNKKKTIL